MKKTIMMMDVCGSSAMWRQDSARMSRHLDKLFEHVSRMVDAHECMLVKTIGDAFMLAFDEVGTAMRFALEFQTTWQKMQPGKALQLRIGIAQGPVMTKRWPIQGCEKIVDYFGNTVNVASRLESHLSVPGGVAVTPITKQVMDILLEQGDGVIKRVKAVDYRDKDAGISCNHQEVLHLKRSARLISVPFSFTFSFSCKSTAHLKNVRPFKALSVILVNNHTSSQSF